MFKFGIVIYDINIRVSISVFVIEIWKKIQINIYFYRVNRQQTDLPNCIF